MADTHRVIFTARATRDLEAIVGYIAERSEQHGPDMAAAIVSAIDSLAFMPGRFRVVCNSRKRKTPIRTIVVYPYLVYYSVDESRAAVHVLTIRHGARRRPRFE